MFSSEDTSAAPAVSDGSVITHNISLSLFSNTDSAGLKQEVEITCEIHNVIMKRPCNKSSYQHSGSL